MLTADPSRKINLKKLLRQPWIQLVETKDGRKKTIPFPVDDKRLVNPALTLAKLEVEGKDTFTPKAFLPAEQQRRIGSGIVGDDDDNDDDEADISLSRMEIY